MKKTEKNVDNKDKTELTTTENTKEEQTIFKTIVKIIKKIFIIITSVVWFPWKVLFIKKEGNRLKDIDGAKKVFRIVRAPFTKTLKFLIFLAIIGLEILIVYKIRYSILSYPLTKSSVENYYLSNEKMNEEEKESLREMFSHVDDWDLDSKNKAYVIFDTKLIKTGFQQIDSATRDLFIDKFNDDEDFREDVHYLTKNVDHILSRAIKELPKSIDDDSLNAVIAPLTNVGASAIDYRAALDILGTVSDTLMKDGTISDIDIELDEKELDSTMDMLIKYAQGMSLEEAYYHSENVK